VFRPFGNDIAEANVNDCLSGKNIDERVQEKQEVELDIVDCSSAEARYKVVGKVPDKSEKEAEDDTICTPFAAAEFSYWKAYPGRKGTVLCLDKIKE
jgi:hypothetical protein